MKQRIVGILSLVAVLALVGCASFATTSQRLTHEAIAASEQLHDQHALTDDQFRATNVELHKIAVAGLAYTQLARAKTATTTDALTFALAIESAVATLRATPFGGTIGRVLDKLSALDTNIRTIISKGTP